MMFVFDKLEWATMSRIYGENDYAHHMYVNVKTCL